MFVYEENKKSTYSDGWQIENRWKLYQRFAQISAGYTLQLEDTSNSYNTTTVGEKLEKRKW